MNEKIKGASRIIAGLLVYAVTLLLLMTAARIIWNLTIPRLFNGPELTLIQIILLYGLAKIFLFDWISAYKSIINSKIVNKKEDNAE